MTLERPMFPPSRRAFLAQAAAVAAGGAALGAAPPRCLYRLRLPSESPIQSWRRSNGTASPIGSGWTATARTKLRPSFQSRGANPAFAARYTATLTGRLQATTPVGSPISTPPAARVPSTTRRRGRCKFRYHLARRRRGVARICVQP
jgi:hypothetical protein